MDELGYSTAPVILSVAKDLLGLVNRYFAALSMTYDVISNKNCLSVILRAELAYHSASLPHLGLAHLAEFLLKLLAIVGL